LKTTFFLPLILTLLGLTAAPLAACDLCGCAIANHPWDPRTGLFLGAAEQYTDYGTVQSNGHELRNRDDQFLHSSITQLYLGYNLTRYFGFQVNVPFIHRSYRRTTGERIEEDSVSGLGDLSILANYTPIHRQDKDSIFSIKLRAGVKLPTGDSDRIGEEAEEGHAHGEAHEHEESDVHEQAEASAVHGHDLALGTGSVDAIVGGSIYARWKSVFFSGDVQYAIRTEGDFDYRYANDLTWSAGPGVYVINRDSHTLALQGIVSGETKREDKFRGVQADDTDITTVFLGPKIVATWRDRLSAEIELDLPIRRDNTGVQIVPDYRVRAALNWAF
jgi:hypothetical protein